MSGSQAVLQMGCPAPGPCWASGLGVRLMQGYKLYGSAEALDLFIFIFKIGYAGTS